MLQLITGDPTQGRRQYPPWALMTLRSDVRRGTTGRVISFELMMELCWVCPDTTADYVDGEQQLRLYFDPRGLKENSASAIAGFSICGQAGCAKPNWDAIRHTAFAMFGQSDQLTGLLGDMAVFEESTRGTRGDQEQMAIYRFDSISDFYKLLLTLQESASRNSGQVPFDKDALLRNLLHWWSQLNLGVSVAVRSANLIALAELIVELASPPDPT
jgi:hypothetical protein